MIDKIKEFGLGTLSIIIGVVFIISVFVFSAILFKWMHGIILVMVPYMNIISVVLLGIGIVILLPLSFVKKYREFISVYMIYSGIFMFVFCLLVGFNLSLEEWGPMGVYVSLFLAGVGIIPIGLVSSGIAGHWDNFMFLSEIIAIMCVFFGYGYYIMPKENCQSVET